MTAYSTNNSISLTNLNDVKNDAGLMAIVQWCLAYLKHHENPLNFTR
jgi:hypothetical protein